MRVRSILTISVLGAVFALAAACGSSNKTIKNGEQIANSSPAASAAANATPTPAPSGVAEYGQPPVLGGNVTDVAPGWGKSVKQADTVIKNKENPRGGVCVDIKYAAPATDATWYRMAVDGQEVTQKLIVVQHIKGPTATTAATGTLCYGPSEPLSLGVHSAAVSVQQPNALTASPLQTVAWKFKVVP
jgi:hypothetical protein